MTIKRLHENHAKGRGSRILLISEGQGSSGFYHADMLKRDGATAFPKGTKIYYNHQSVSGEYELNGSRDVRDLIGVTTSEVSWSDIENGLEADTDWLPHAKTFVESVWEHTGLSVEANGVVNDDGVVESLAYSPLNAIALVPVAGRGGKIQSLVEGFREKCDSISNDESEPGKEDPGMKPEEITALAEALAEAMKPSFNDIKEALKPAEVETVVEEEGEDTATVAEALVASGLPASARTKVYEAVKAGTPVADAIAAEKSYIEDVLNESKSDDDETFTGRVQESAAGTERPAFKAWG